eukprot:7879342-Lingulodinium_polyedra.AAC.1
MAVDPWRSRALLEAYRPVLCREPVGPACRRYPATAQLALEDPADILAPTVREPLVHPLLRRVD